jgi:hypothetical protein
VEVESVGAVAVGWAAFELVPVVVMPLSVLGPPVVVLDVLLHALRPTASVRIEIVATHRVIFITESPE